MEILRPSPDKATRLRGRCRRQGAEKIEATSLTGISMAPTVGGKAGEAWQSRSRRGDAKRPRNGFGGAAKEKTWEIPQGWDICRRKIAKAGSEGRARKNAEFWERNLVPPAAPEEDRAWR